MTFVRNEADLYVRDLATFVVGGLGGLMVIGGLFFGTLFKSFLLPQGCMLAMLGLLFVCVFIGMRGAEDQWGFRAGWALGAAGALAFLVAFVRSFVLRWLAKAGAGQLPEPYLMPYGLLLMAIGLLTVGLAVGIISDNRFVVLTRRELVGTFFSPIAYVVLFGIMVIAWWLFVQWVVNALWSADPIRGQVATQTIPEPIVEQYFLNWFPVICLLFIVPVLTMRLVSEEKRTGTMEMMLTLPVNETLVVLSKFTAALVFFMLTWLPWAGFLLTLRVEGGQPFDFLPLLAFYIALLCSGAAFISMGLFFSSLTRNQIGAAILTFVGMVALTLVFFLRSKLPLSEGMRSVLQHVSYVDLWFAALDGRLGMREIIFFVSAAVFWLFLTVKALEVRKWW
jgi:ABC-type transport system involved in multi-copper enzyme maturation permease subunit